MILALVMLIAFILFFILRQPSEIDLRFDQDSIESYLKSCLRQTASSSLELLGKQGGTIQLQEHVAAPHYGISYAVRDSENTLYSTQHMESQLSGDVKNHLNDCLKDFTEFKKGGWEVDAGTLGIRTSINLEDASFIADYPLTVRQGEGTISISSFTISLPVRLSGMHEAMNTVAEFWLQHDKTDLTYLNSIGFNTTVFPYKDALVVRLMDNHLLNNRPFAFQAALS